MRRVSPSEMTSKPELEVVFPVLPVVVRIMASASMKPVEVVSRMLEEPANITPLTFRFPVAVTVPVAETLNCVDEPTWKSMKLPFQRDGFAPSNVPEAEPNWMPVAVVFGERRTREEVADSARRLATVSRETEDVAPTPTWLVEVAR